MKFNIDNIVNMTIYDKDHNPLWTADEIDPTVVETEAITQELTDSCVYIIQGEEGALIYNNTKDDILLVTSHL